jgi:hypothetical protein
MCHPPAPPHLSPTSPPFLPGFDGRIGTNFLTTLVKFTGLYVDPWVRALQTSEFRSADRLELVTLFKYLEFCLEQVGGAGCVFVWVPSEGIASHCLCLEIPRAC